MKATTPENELERLEALRRYNILDTQAEQVYDDLTRIAAHIAQTPIALISLVDRDRQWFKSKVGLQASETPREMAFCAHAILNPGMPLVVPDATKDARFADNSLVTGKPDIRFYFGAPLVTPDQFALGTLCAIDTKPRRMTPEQISAMTALSRQVVVHLELRRHAAELRQMANDREVYLSQLLDYQQKLERANARLQVESETDALTGLGNRRAFDQRLAEEVYRSNRYQSPLSLLALDADRFKDYNDAFGHPAGDLALQSIAGALRGVMRPSDFLARTGGEEFAAILPTTARPGAGILAERLRRAVGAAPLAHGAITVSVGVASLSGASQDAPALQVAADRALYAAKNGGRNTIAFAEPA